MDKNSDISIIPRILFFWYLTVFVSTELLSFFNLINRPLIISINLIFFTTNLFFYRQKIINLLRHFFVKHHLFFYIAILILILTFIQGFFSAPNTTDSMVRRLPIVMYWVQEHTLYQDTIRNGHDFMAPFAEYIFLHLYLIFNGDRMLFLSQWTAFGGVIVLSLLIAQKLGASPKATLSILILVTTLPIAVLQATSVQTDMVTTIMVLFSVYFALLFINAPTLTNWVLLNCALGLGILTKSTFLLYVIIPFGILLPFIIRQWRKSLLLVTISLFVIGIIQLRFMEQNLRLYGGILGQGVLQGKSGYTNELITPQVILSNLIRNLIVQVPFPIGKETVERWVIYIHEKMGLMMDDPRTNFYDTKFSVYPIIFPQEDIAGNPIHLILIFLAGLILAIKYKKIKNKSLGLYLYLLVVISFLIFSTVLKWQPFHSRLLMPFFIIGSISSVIILFEGEKLRGYLNILMISSICLSLILILLNVSKPFISYNQFYPLVKSLAPPLSSIPESVFIKDKEKQLFNARYYWHDPYKEVIEKAKEKKISGTITFKLIDEFEYPMWYFLKKDKLSLKVLPYSKQNKDTTIISTSKTPFYQKGYLTECIKTEIDYGYACISIP